MCTELVAFLRVEGALEEGAEDGGFDLTPFLLAGFDHEAQLLLGQVEGARVGEQPAVEVQQVRGELRTEPARVSLPGKVDSRMLKSLERVRTRLDS
jgi:hypothetical protein